MIHCDVRGTKDNVPILNHDKDLSRQCQHGRFTQDFLYKDLPKISAPEIDMPFVVDEQSGKT
jgi:glycerophosphoryl diester phosphodiesterase